MKRGWLRRGLIAATILTYAVLAHYSNANPRARALGAVLAMAPLLAALWFIAARSRHPVSAALAVAVLGAALLWALWGQIELHFALVILLQQCGAYLALALIFGRSLLPGAVPLCTHWAASLHGPLAPDVLRYTRAVTTFWAAYFIAVAALSSALYIWAPLQAWSVFSNFLTLPLAVLMFVGEYALRQRLVPSMHRITLRDTARAYFRSPSGGTSPW